MWFLEAPLPALQLDLAMTEQQIRERIQYFTHLAHPSKLQIVTDTSEFMSIRDGDVLELDGRFYLIRGEEIEGRFGLNGEPKFWVKKAIDLETGQAKVIKLVFHESLPDANRRTTGPLLSQFLERISHPLSSLEYSPGSYPY